jgi:cytochrome c biogenesis protein CcmG/thiol:disulfide interchange protein DsbE
MKPGNRAVARECALSAYRRRILDGTYVAGQQGSRRRAFLMRVTALAALAAGGLAAPAAFSNGLAVGKAAPPLVLIALDGYRIATRDLLGQVVIANFWATWCAPCLLELPTLSGYAARHAAQGLQVLGFSLDTPDALPEVRRIAATLSFPVGLLGSNYAGDYGRIWRIPVTFVIDRAGRLAHDGWSDKAQPWTDEQLHRVVDPLLLRQA